MGTLPPLPPPDGSGIAYTSSNAASQSLAALEPAFVAAVVSSIAAVAAADPSPMVS